MVRERPASVETFLSDSVVESSRGRAWPGIEVMRSRNVANELEVDGLRAHTLAINVGRSYRVEGRIDGQVTGAHMPTGAMKIVEAGPKSVWQWDAGEPIEVLHVSIDDTALRAYASELAVGATPEFFTRVGFVDAGLGRIGRALSDEIRAPSISSLVADSLRIELILRMLNDHSSFFGRNVIRIPNNRLTPRTLRLIDDYVDTNLGQDVGIGALADLAGMSRFHFSRVFHATVGTSPYRFVLDRRLERARNLLRSTTLSLSHIANMTGFVDQSHLTRHVKRRFGVTPGVLRAS